MKLTKTKLREIVREELIKEDKAVDEFRRGILLALQNLKNIKLTRSELTDIQKFLTSVLDIVDGK